MDVTDNWTTQLRKGVLELCVLNVVGQASVYGYDIVKRLRSIDALVIREGTVYPILSRLKRDGLVSTSLQESPEGPARKYYELTPRGELVRGEMNAYWEVLKRGMDTLKQGFHHDDDGATDLHPGRAEQPRTVPRPRQERASTAPVGRCRRRGARDPGTHRGGAGGRVRAGHGRALAERARPARQPLPGWRRLLLQLSSGREDWRLAYLTLGLFLGCPLLGPAAPLAFFASILVARAGLALLDERGEPVGARRWFLYPPLVFIYVDLAIVALILPPLPLLVLAIDAPPELLAVRDFFFGGLPDPFWLSTASDRGGRGNVVAGAGLALAGFRRAVRWSFWPFADWFEPRHGLRIALVGLVIAAVSGLGSRWCSSRPWQERHGLTTVPGGERRLRPPQFAAPAARTTVHRTARDRVRRIADRPDAFRSFSYPNYAALRARRDLERPSS